MKAQIVAVLGGTGSGKTTRVLSTHLRPRPPRLLIWDFKRDPLFAGLGEVVNAQQLVAGITRAKFTMRYQPSFDAKRRAEEFDWFCSIAYHVGNMTVWIEELPQVTKAGWSPGPWAAIVMTGREYSVGGKAKHLGVVATGQRTATLDKSFLSNATVIECGVLEYPTDQKTMAEYLRCKPETLQLLKPGQFVRRCRGETNFTIVGKPF